MRRGENPCNVGLTSCALTKELNGYDTQSVARLRGPRLCSTAGVVAVKEGVVAAPGTSHHCKIRDRVSRIAAKPRGTERTRPGEMECTMPRGLRELPSVSACFPIEIFIALHRF